MIAFPYYQYLESVGIENHCFDGWLVERCQPRDEPADCVSVMAALFVVSNRLHSVWILFAAHAAAQRERKREMENKNK